MPHAVFDNGPSGATRDIGGRQLIPGVEPGGSRAGEATKPALRIRDAWLEVIDFATLFANTEVNVITIYLKLSQETDLSPGLLLPVGQVIGEQLSGIGTGSPTIIDLFHAQGTVWAPRMVGKREVEVGDVNWDIDMHLDYEQVDVPWMDWFIMWDFLDNIVDNEREY